jgi:hypothetical protein
MCELYTARAIPVAQGMRAVALAKRIFPDRAMATRSADLGPRKGVPARIALIPGQQATRTLSELSKLSHPGVGVAPQPTFIRMPDFVTMRLPARSSPGQPGLEGSRAAERSPQPVHRVARCGGRVEAGGKRRLGGGIDRSGRQDRSRRDLEH